MILFFGPFRWARRSDPFQRCQPRCHASTDPFAEHRMSHSATDLLEPPKDSRPSTSPPTPTPTPARKNHSPKLGCGLVAVQRIFATVYRCGAAPVLFRAPHTGRLAPLHLKHGRSHRPATSLSRILCYRGPIRSMPIQRRSASGTTMLPSDCW
jgi:hypothetical protein